MAIMLATAPRDRVRAGIVLTVVVTVASVLNALQVDGTVVRTTGATLLLVGQTLFTVLLYDRFAKGASPLSGTVPYAYALSAAVLGTIPMTVLAALARTTK